MKRCKAVTRFVVKKSCRRVCKRITSLLLAATLLFSSVSTGVLVPQTEVKAIAGVDDLTLLTEFLKMVIALASAAGGISNSEMLVSADAAGITSWEDARGYVHGSFSGDPNFQQLFDFDTEKLIQMECLMAAGVAMGGYVFSQKYLKKLWAQYDPREDGWDPEKWSDLTEKEKVKIIYDVSDVMVNAGIIPVGPPDGGDDDDKDEDPDGSNYKKHYKEGGKLIDEEGNLLVLESGAVNAAFTTATFQTVYYLAKKLNREEKKNQFIGEESGVFNYHFQDWAVQLPNSFSQVDVFSVYSSSLSSYPSAAFGFAPTFLGKNDVRPNPNFDKFSVSHVYPCLFWKDGKPHLGMTTDKGFWSCPYAMKLKVKNSSSSSGNYVYFSPRTGEKFQEIDLHNIPNMPTDFNYNEFDHLIRNRDVLISEDRNCVAPWLIDCETEPNFKKFTELVQSGDYTLNQLLECMRDGWKGLPKKSWQSVEDKGETAKKVINSDKGKKYKETGKKYSADGTKTEGEGVSFSSLVDGMTAPEHDMEGSLTSPKTGADDLLGDQVTLPEPVKFPSSEDYPDGAFFIPNAEIPPSPPDKPDPTPTPTPEPTPTPAPGAAPVLPGTDSDLQWYERFPFCIPWDLYNGVSALQAKTKIPKWDIPFEIKRLNIKEKITIDLTPYEKLAAICRWFFRILFATGLVLISRHIIKG